MEASEKIALLIEISNQGFLFSECEEGGTIIRKISTLKNPSSFVRRTEPSVLVSSVDDALSLIKSVICWEWKPEQKEIILPVAEHNIKFSAYVMFESITGPSSVDMGTIEHHDGNEAQRIAETRAREYFKNNLPRYDFDQTKKVIRIRPILE